MPIYWKMKLPDAEKYVDLVQRLQNVQISDEEFAEELSTLPGYPLTRAPLPGDDLRIIVEPMISNLPAMANLGNESGLQKLKEGLN